ncbi:MAG: DUF1559 domain-containing protein [Opitutaceae bacterium]|jgi:prepilin-type N-terminal cleavage/methylation domain-containing protein|nr:DUF1559 domain-containing protein [Opitutaceae bacterium]
MSIHTSRTAFTLVELLVVIAIIGILAGIMIPATLAVRRKARDVECISNLRQIGTAIASYAAENKDCYPPNPYGAPDYPANVARWYYLLSPYIGKGYTNRREEGSIFICPSNRWKPKGYAYATFEDYGYLCNLQLMPKLDTGTPFPHPIRMSSVTRKRILVSDTLKNTETEGKILWVYYNNAARENSSAPFDPLEKGRWQIHHGGIHALWTNFSVTWLSEGDANRPGSQIPGGQYFGRGD